MKCSNCGKENLNGAKFCAECGTVLSTQSQPMQSQYAQENEMQNIPPEYKPISMWGYFGYELLFAIPLVGFIVLLVFAFGGTSNKNVKNFARSYFCFFIIVAVLIAVIAMAGGLMFSTPREGVSREKDIYTKDTDRVIFQPEEVGISSEKLKADAMTEYGDMMVYWTPFGKVYHTDVKCPAMNQTDTITEGTVEQAIAANRTRLCTYCEKCEKRNAALIKNP